MLLFATFVGAHVLALHVLSDLVYPLEQDVQMLALFLVQAAPVAAAPLEHEHVFEVHSRLEDDEHGVVSLVPAPQADRHSVQTSAVPVVSFQ